MVAGQSFNERRKDDAVMMLCGLFHTVTVALFAATYFLCMAFDVPIAIPLLVKVVGVMGYVALAGYGLLRICEPRRRTGCPDHDATIADVAELDRPAAEP